MARSGKLWLDRKDAMVLADFKEAAFRSNIQEHLSEDDIRQTSGRGEALKFWAPAIVKRLIEIASAPETTSEPELAGDGSPALERYRDIRAESAEYDLEIKRGDLMRRVDVHEGLAEAGSIIRRHAARLVKGYGVEAERIMKDAVEDMLRVNERLFGGDETNATDTA